MKTERKELKSLLMNFLSLVVVQGTNYIVPLLTFPYLVRVLGTTGYGAIAYTLAFNQYLVIFSGWGFNLSAPKEVVKYRNDPKQLDIVFSSVILLKLILMCISFFILVISIELVPKLCEYKELVYFTFGVVIGQAIIPTWFFQGIEKMKWITVVNAIAKLFYALALILIVKEEKDITLVPILNSAGYLIAGIVGLFLCIKNFKVKLLYPGMNNLIYHFKSSFQFFVSRVSVSIYTASNVFVIGTFGSVEMAGIYSVAEKLYQALQGIYHPLVNALYPFIIRKKDVRIFSKIFIGSIVANILFVVSFYLLADNIFLLLFKNYSIESVKLFKLLTLVCIVIVPSILLGYPFLAAFGHPKFANLSVAIASLVHLCSLTILVLTNNIVLEYIVVALFLTEIIVLIIRIYGSVKYKLWIKYQN